MRVGSGTQHRQVMSVKDLWMVELKTYIENHEGEVDVEGYKCLERNNTG